MTTRARFYDLATGIFTGGGISADAAVIAANTPAGLGAYLVPPGAPKPDPLSQRVDITAQPPDPPLLDEFDQPIPWLPPLIDYQPPAPADDQWQTWAWDAGTKRWVSTPTLAAVKRSARQRMAAAWNEAKAQGVTFGAKTAPTDADSWTRYLAIKEMAAEGGWIDVPIPLADGTFELMTQAKMITLWGALKTMERTLLTQLRDRIQAINSATTAAEVDAVTWG
jgi:hypothetical protein